MANSAIEAMDGTDEWNAALSPVLLSLVLPVLLSLVSLVSLLLLVVPSVVVIVVVVLDVGSMMVMVTEVSVCEVITPSNNLLLGSANCSSRSAMISSRVRSSSPVVSGKMATMILILPGSTCRISTRSVSRSRA